MDTTTISRAAITAVFAIVAFTTLTARAVGETSKSIGADGGTVTFLASSDTGNMSDVFFSSSDGWLSYTGSKMTNYITYGGWSLELDCTASANTAANSRTGTITGTQNGKVVMSFTVVQEGARSIVLDQPDVAVVESGFGPGYASDFAISSSERAFVVGFYGLKWSDFPVRKYDGYHVFTDARIVDREKHKGKSAKDHTYCVDYANLDILVWGGWTASYGYTDEDALGEAILDDDWDDYEAAFDDAAARSETIATGSTFAQSLSTKLVSADGMLAMIVFFDNYTWYGEKFSGKPGIGHGIVCCGYSYNPGKKSTDPEYLKGLFIIESDNDREQGSGGASAPDTITYCPMTWDSSKKRYSISNIFGAKGYFDDRFDGTATLVRAKNAVALNLYTEPPSGASEDVGDVSGNADAAYSKAQTLLSVLYDAATGDVAGAVQLKVGKKSKKNVVKVSGTATLLNGKKVAAKAVSVNVGSGSASETLVFKAPVGSMAFAVSSSGRVTLSNASYVARAAYKGVGGKLDATTMYANVEVGDFNVPDGYELLEDALPENVKVTVKNGTKWSTPAAPTLKYKRTKGKDGSSSYTLVGLDDEKKPNLSGLKLSYTAKTGAFKGSFKLYATNEGSVAAGKAPKLKNYTVNVNGLVVDGIGYGQATCKKPAAGPWIVTVK